jgi:penicillin-binding protein 1C
VYIPPTATPRPAVPAGRVLVGPDTAFLITDILSDPEARAFIFGRGGSLDFPFEVAVKTGTSQAYHDNWTIGYSRRVTVGVWVGNFDRTPLRNSSGVTGAAPIFHAVMLAAERRLAGSGAAFSQAPILTPPPDTVERDICALSGMPATDACPVRLHEWVPAGEPEVPCSWHHVGDEGPLTVWPPEYQQWARANGLLERDAPVRTVSVATHATRQAARPAPAAAALMIVSPPNDATYLIDPTLRREFQAIPLRAAGDSLVQWSVAGQVIGSSAAGAALDWPLTPGRHTFVARDGSGHTAEATITVR